MPDNSAHLPTKKIFCMSLGLELDLVLGGVMGTLREYPLLFAGSEIVCGIVLVLFLIGETEMVSRKFERVFWKM